MCLEHLQFKPDFLYLFLRLADNFSGHLHGLIARQICQLAGLFYALLILSFTNLVIELLRFHPNVFELN